jgi:mRNA interferase MazF
VIIQSDRFASSTVTVALTSASAGPAVYRPEFTIDGRRSRILTDQIYTVAPGRLGAFRGSLEPAERRELDQALMVRLGLL